jgi:hypothetical protein
MDFIIITAVIAWVIIKAGERKREKTGDKYRNK